MFTHTHITIWLQEKYVLGMQFNDNRQLEVNIVSITGVSTECQAQNGTESWKSVFNLKKKTFTVFVLT